MERSLPPTARRLDLARRAGAVLTSPAAVSAIALAAAVLAAGAALGITTSALTALARDGWSHAADPTAADRAVRIDGAALVTRTAGLVAPIALAVAGAALLATAVFARGLIVPRRRLRNAPVLADDAGARTADALIGTVRAAVAITVGVRFVLDSLPALAALASRAPPAIAATARDLTLGALLHVTVAAVVASALELAIRAARRRDALRMTVREARDELRETAGDPAARRRQREARHGDVRARVADAVILLVSDDVAVAIGWRPGDEPRVLARGTGVIARALRTAARIRHVPIVTAPSLAAALRTTGLIPPSHQPALAELLAALRLGPR